MMTWCISSAGRPSRRWRVAERVVSATPRKRSRYIYYDRNSSNNYRCCNYYYHRRYAIIAARFLAERRVLDFRRSVGFTRTKRQRPRCVLPIWGLQQRYVRSFVVNEKKKPKTLSLHLTRDNAMQSQSTTSACGRHTLTWNR